MLDLRAQRVLVTGGSGFLGRTILAHLRRRGLPDAALAAPRRDQFDLTDPADTRRLYAQSFGGQGPTLVLNCAGFVGGLGANRQWPARFFHDNLVIPINIVEQARAAGLIERGVTIVQVGTMCSYPADAPCPYREDSLFRGLPDPEIAPYGVARLAALELLRAYRRQHGLRCAYVLPTGFFGPGDNTNPANSHVIGALIRKYADAARAGTPEVVNWGSGSPLRDFIYIDDAAEGVLRAAEIMSEPTPINLTGGEEVTIRDLAQRIARLCGYSGRTVWDASKGDGQARRSLDPSRARDLLDWAAPTTLDQGLRRAVEWYRSNPSA